MIGSFPRWLIGVGAVCIATPVLTDSGQTEATIVRTSAELVAALRRAGPGQRVHATRGRYVIAEGLTIPDGVTLYGDGVMLLDEAGIPRGFAADAETTIVAAADMAGNVVTLGNGATIQGVQLLDVASDHRNGNVVAVVSRAENDSVSAKIFDCEIATPQTWGFDDAGPTGRAVAILTLDPALEHDPPPHRGARLDVRIERSIVSAAASDALFVDNFASDATATVVLRHNRIEGILDAAAGTNRPDSVTHSSTTIESQRNSYVLKSDDASKGTWKLIASSNPPHFGSAATSAASFNTLRVRGIGDRIEGPRLGIVAIAARRMAGSDGPLAGNVVDLQLTDVHITTPGDRAADLEIYALQLPSSTDEAGAVDGNRIDLRFDGVRGSGARANVYALRNAPAAAVDPAAGNVIRVIGTPEEFARSNPDIDPPPPARFFTGKD